MLLTVKFSFWQYSTLHVMHVDLHAVCHMACNTNDVSCHKMLSNNPSICGRHRLANGAVKQ